MSIKHNSNKRGNREWESERKKELWEKKKKRFFSGFFENEAPDDLFRALVITINETEEKKKTNES